MKKRALLSTFDKSNIVEFASGLIELGFEIISTGNTYNLLKENNIETKSIEEITNFKEILDGRVKTLNPYIHGAILFKRDDDKHLNTVNELNISSIDMVVVNLYPFEKVLNENASHETLIENIDIGGPAMLRSASKNYKDVIVVTDINDYEDILLKLKEGSLDLEYRKKLAYKAFSLTAHYDSLISNYFKDLLDIKYPEILNMSYKKHADLRYGENPHQKAAFYEAAYEKNEEKTNFKQLHGKEISYNNLIDIYAAVRIIKDFDKPCAVGIKHTNPCGLAIADNIDDAFFKAYECDPVSIFGGIIALNREVTKKIAEKINSFFVEIVIANKFSEEAMEILTKKKNIRIIEIDNLIEFKLPDLTFKQVLNGIVAQDYNTDFLIEDLQFVTDKKPSEKELEELLFAFKACKHVASNGIVVAKNNATIGIGQGEVRRSFASEQAVTRAKEKIEGAVVASDAFFFEDTVELLHEYGIKAVIQPGGSIKDENVIKLCNEYGIAMVFTKIRHFRH